MEVLYAKCAGLDVHKEVIVACARIGKSHRVQRWVESFATTTQGILALGEWLRDHGCTHVGMEATGVYWKPVWHLLEGQFALTLANAAAVRNVPGRKSDVNDATWLADLLAHGLIRGSFVPPAPIQQLRDLTRTRKQLVREIGQHTQRLQKTLEDAHVKITGVISDLLGVSGRAVLRGIIAGETDPERLLALTSRLQAPRQRLLDGLQGAVTDHHRFLLRLHLDHIEGLEKLVREVEAQMEQLLDPFDEQFQRLLSIPGVSRIVAQTLLAEIGPDMSRFPSPAHLRSWAGLCPRMDQSAGKSRSNRLRHGNHWLKTVLVQAAWAASRSKDTYLRSQFFRLRSRRGPKKAAVAVAASILTAAYFILRDGLDYKDLGPHYLDRLDKDKAAQRLTRRLRDLGYQVDLRPAA
jgi:transposase